MDYSGVNIILHNQKKMKIERKCLKATKEKRIDISRELRDVIDHLITPAFRMKQLARHLGVNYQTLVRWKRGEVRDPKKLHHKRAVKKIFKLAEGLQWQRKVKL